MTTYHTLITNSGKAQIANAINTNTKVAITHLAVGDGRGATPTPSAGATRLTAEKARVAVNHVGRHDTHANWIEVHAIIPSSTGGFTVREIGLYAGTTLIAVGSFPATYKPSATEGGSREMSIKLIIAVENASVVNVTLDDSLVYATRKWTQDNFVNHDEVIDNLTSTETTKPLSAAQGKALNEVKLGKTENAASATKLQTARTLAITGDGKGQANFDGSANANIALTLANSGVTPGSYNSVTVDAKGRVTAGLTQTHGLVTATTATGTANTVTTNSNTFLNIVASGVGQTASVGSSTQITGTNGITVSSDTAGKLIVGQVLANSLTDTSTAKALTALQGKVLDESKLGNSGHQTINGQLGITRNAWEKLRFTNSDGSFWRFESAPISSGENGARFNYVFVGSDNNEVGRISFPRVSSGETIAYQSWVRNANVASATKLQTARTINGVAFDGTQNITIVDNTKLANTGNPTLNGRLSITNNEWAKLNFPLQDGSQWFIEANPSYKTAQTGGLGIRFLCEDGNARRFYDLVKSDKNEIIAYQSWTNNELAKKANVSHRHNWNEIDGKPAVINNPTRISSGDLNDYKDAGFYLCESNVEARAIANTASNRAFALQVVQVAGVVQIYYEYESATIYSRAFYAHTNRWSAWKQLATTDDNAASASKLATARSIAMTGDGSWNVNFDGSQNATGALTLANSGVTAGSYNSVTVDAKGRVTAGLTQTHGLVTATTATGTANVATGNGNTFLNIVASGVGQTASVGSSTQITGTNGITVSSDTAGKLIVTRDSNSPTATRLQTARTISLTGAVTGNANFDGSGNVSISTTLTKAVIRDHSRTINAPRVGYTTNTIGIAGQTVVSPDGRITQYFHLKHFRDFWFDLEDAGIGTGGDRGYTIPLALWTAMPNKVLSVIAAPMRSTNATLSTPYLNEASELIAAWAYRKQGSDRSNVWVDLARHSGGSSEPIDLFVIVEGY